MTQSLKGEDIGGVNFHDSKAITTKIGRGLNMPTKISLDEAKGRALELMHKNYH